MVSRTLSWTDVMNDEERIRLLNVLFCRIVSVLFILRNLFDSRVHEQNLFTLLTTIGDFENKEYKTNIAFGVFFSLHITFRRTDFFFSIRCTRFARLYVRERRQTLGTSSVVNIIITIFFFLYFKSLNLSLLPIGVNGYITERQCPYTVCNKNVNRQTHMVLKINEPIEFFDFQSGSLVTITVVAYRGYIFCEKSHQLTLTFKQYYMKAYVHLGFFKNKQQSSYYHYYDLS